MRKPVVLLLLGLMLIMAGCASTAAVGPSDEAFLRDHGWTASRRVASHSVKLPDHLADEPGAFPVGLYWAYNNVLSADAGLDFQPYAGKQVTATLYQVTETLDDGNPNRALRAVVLRHEGKVVGAYLDRLGHFGFAASLRRRTFSDIVGKPFGKWLEDAQVVDYAHPAYQALAQLQPDQLIRAYWDAIDRHDYTRAYTMLTLDARSNDLFANRHEDALYNPGFSFNWGGLENMRSARSVVVNPQFRDITLETRATPELNRRLSEARQYSATVDVSFRAVIGRNSGSNHYFVSVVKETERAPWLLDAFNSGP